MDLQAATQHLRLLSDPTRVRLLLLLDREEFSVAELAAITQLAQPRVSTHLARLKEAGLVADRRDGVFVYYRIARQDADGALASLWRLLRKNTQDPLVQQDLDRVLQVLNRRSGKGTWADSVAGVMERHYSPGRTWEATARGMVHLIDPGSVLDIASGDGVLAELLAPRADSIVCLDISRRVADAGRKRLAGFTNVSFEVGDMHQLPLEDAQFDTVLLMHALTYTPDPERVFDEVNRVLKPGGRLLAVTLEQHRHEKAVEPFNHVNLGFSRRQLESLATKAGLDVLACTVSAVEKRSPNFSVLAISAVKPIH
ncbi:MAG: metalloregulator ArsR/SmtB family transcription factor [Xanthomonadales bacterium]|nr:metalloregulator ArsR/SmtB family transcription factor [Gammaproteobacteria bacterium]MBT8049983.1 metalloregulator ArsR/SmtB family transcription factor [Gammaproteobacteria bacterium]MBT8057616.1 metalloregulator ArsR/SmtB family transcription factor [Gammaproteobacteria bacterium]NNJ79699.1 metalloregulator ArsR/SmtB family transcription factor [Xanthomonadales bacterium]NNL05005.1 metalloregulator ArsR/SmtB family transcription factor [Xanthomonadales bacterium]